MLYFERCRKTIVQRDITLTSWLDRQCKIYRALAPHYINVVHDWAGVTGVSRDEALDRLTELLTTYLTQHSAVIEEQHENKGDVPVMGFERTKQSIHGHEVTVTSWFEQERQVWRALAPAYLHVIHDWPAASLQGRSRQEAVKNIASLLHHYFEGSS